MIKYYVFATTLEYYVPSKFNLPTKFNRLNIVILLPIDNSRARTRDVVILSAIAMLREQQGQLDNAVVLLVIHDFRLDASM